MTRTLCILATLAVLIVSGRLDAQPTVVWARFASNVPFHEVHLNEQNQAFCLTSRGAVYRYDASGNLLGASPDIGANIETPRMIVDSANSVYVLYVVPTASGSLVRMRQVGGWDIAVDTETPTWKYFRAHALHLDGNGKICAVYARRSAGSSFQWRFRRFNVNGTLFENSGGVDVVTQGAFQGKSVLTTDGRVIWAYRTFGQANTTVVQASPAYAFTLSMPGVADIAYSPLDGGALFGVALPNSTSLTLYRLDLTTGIATTRSMATSDLDPAMNTQMTTAPRIACDSNGNPVVVGQYLNAGGTKNFQLSLNGTNLSTTALLNQILFTAVDVAPDPNGAMIFGLSNGSSEARVSVVDNLNWVSLGHASQTANQYNPKDLAVNAKGFAAVVGDRRTSAGGSLDGFVWLVRQAGLMNITTPLAEITGGQTFNTTIRRYYANGIPLTVSLSSNSPKAPIQGSVQISSLATSATASVQLAASGTDELITLEATSGLAKRQAKFWLKAPRPKTLTLNPTSINSPASGLATVVLTGIAPTSGITLTLSSSNPNVIVPGTKVIASGLTSGNFTVKTVQIAVTQTAVISASYLGVTRTATQTVTP